MSEGRVLPKSVDYTKILPLAVESRSRRRSFFPVNGQSFVDNANNIIRIDVSASAFLDTKHSYLRFRLTNNSGQTMGFDFGGGHGVIRRLRIEQAGTVLSDINHYNKLLSSIVLPSQSGTDGLAHRSLTEGQRFANDHAASMTPAPAAEVSGAIVNTPANSNALVANGGTYTFSIPLVNGLLGTTQDKMVPLQLLGSSPLTIEIELAPLLDVGIFAVAAPVAGTSYTIDNVRYIAQLVEVGPEVDAQLRMVQEMSGGKLVLNGTDYTHFNGNIPAGALGNQVVNVPARRKSLKSLFFVGASTTYAAAGAGGAEHNFVYNLSYGGNFAMTDYQIKIGSVVYPPTPVDCQFAGGSAFQRSEALSELAKCWGTVSSAHGTGCLSTVNTYVADCDVANMTVDAGAAAATNSLRFSPFGLDLEAFQRTAIESGINTASSSLPISLILNVGAPGNAEAVNIDCYVSYDSLYYIDETGAIRVSM
jgi:hypothetical protein